MAIKDRLTKSKDLELSENGSEPIALHCIYCLSKENEIRKLKQIIVELNDECSHVYRLHEDDLARLNELESSLSKVLIEIENDIIQNHSIQKRMGNYI